MSELEADKLPNVPHPRTNKKMFGHESSKNIFIKSLKKNKLHHAWLIHGPKGVGKATLAWKITKLLQNGLHNFDQIEEENKLSLTSRRIEALSEQSVLLCRRQFDKTKKKLLQEISVNEIRKINHFFSLSNTTSKYRIVIIDNINELSISASNALLKLLEEPPLDGIFILICENKRSVLPTIISRCRILECNSLDFKNFEKGMLTIYDKENMTPENLNQLFELSGGSIGKSIEIFDNNGLEIFNKLINILISDNEEQLEKFWELLLFRHNFETAKEYHKFLFEFVLYAIALIGKSLVTKKNSSLFKLKLKKENNHHEDYFPYSLLHSVILKDLNNALEVNLNLSDLLFTSVLKIIKINKKILKV